MGLAIATFLRHILIAAAVTLVIAALASVGLLVTTAPEALSLAVEPLSLLLVPGLLVAVLTSSLHDISPVRVLSVSLVFYFLLTFFLLRRHARKQSR